ncbi:MAG: exosome complex protein Rrp42 [archaeon]|nr:MAG: exosome complex protein Rrp42 [archaeon]
MKLSKINKEKIRELLENKERLDGRGLLDFRELSIETGISSKAEGSARVKLGDTEVIVGVKIDILEPYPDSPDSGVMMVTAELSPLASDEFESGPPGINAIGLARSVDRAIRESNFIDTKKLCIKKEEKVWGVFIDIYPTNDAGNLVDASALAAVAALLECKIPKLDGEKVNHEEHSNKKLPLNTIPLTVTAYKVNDTFILDPTSEEESSSKTKITASVTFNKDEPTIHGMIKIGEEPIEIEQLLDMVNKISKQAKKLKDKISKSKK